MADLTSYGSDIVINDDRTLFEEAVKCAKVEAFRASYLLIWLSCAESLKRRFKEAAKRDSNALQISGNIQRKEENHQSVDLFILDESKKYGFITDPEHTRLNHIYEMRCLYGHPYESQPTEEQLFDAASTVVECVLKKPATLKHGFCQSLHDALINEPNYLDDTREAVETFAKEVVARIDPSVFIWFLDKYLNSLESIADDASMLVFRRRGGWFLQYFLSFAKCSILSENEWHDRARRYPKILFPIVAMEGIYEAIGERAQTTLVREALSNARSRTKGLLTLELLLSNGLLSDRQSEVFNAYLKAEFSTSEGASFLKNVTLKVNTCFDAVINGLASHTFYIQRPTMEYLTTRDVEEISELTQERQEQLGRNILQVADGGEYVAKAYLRKVDERFPDAFIYGILIECYLNDAMQLRFKDDEIAPVLQLIGKLDKERRDSMLARLKRALADSNLKHSHYNAKHFDQPIKDLSKFEWSSEIIDVLKLKQPQTPTEE